jgi:hypothetical protein
MRGHRYVYNRLYRWDPSNGAQYAGWRPWIAECHGPQCTKWKTFHKTWRHAWNAAYRHQCPVVITIG